MSVTSVVEVFNGREASHEISNVRKYKRVYLVTTTAMTDGPFTVGANVTGIPGLFNYYTDPSGAVDLGAIVQGYNVSQGDDPFTWKVEVQYSSALEVKGSPRGDGRSGRSGKAEQAQKGQEDQNPLNRPPVIKYGASKHQKPIDRAYDANNNLVALKNSAGEYFDPVVEIDDSRIVVTIDRNEAAVSLGTFAAYQDTVNLNIFAGQPVRTGKLNITAQTGFENNQFYWQVTYTIEWRRDTWDLNLLDRGIHVLDPLGSGKLVNAYDPVNGAAYTTAVLLDGAGNQLAQGGSAVYLNFRPYQAVDWTPLNLPQNL